MKELSSNTIIHVSTKEQSTIAEKQLLDKGFSNIRQIAPWGKEFPYLIIWNELKEFMWYYRVDQTYNKMSYEEVFLAKNVKNKNPKTVSRKDIMDAIRHALTISDSERSSLVKGSDVDSITKNIFDQYITT